MARGSKTTEREESPVNVVTHEQTPQLSRKESRARGKNLREKCPRESHGFWHVPTHRGDPVRMLEESSKGRIPQLIPIRYGRMLQSPFTFYRGAAFNMAADLATTAVTGPYVQACGDCHLSNFGAFATPERRVIVDINDLDETLPAPWEWDLKRLAASMVVASRNNGHREDQARAAAQACVRSYRERMSEFSRMKVLEVWYASIELQTMIDAARDKEAKERAERRLANARERSVLEHDFPVLVDLTGDSPRIKDEPPLLFHPHDQHDEDFAQAVQRGFASYRESLPDHRRLLLDRYKLLDIAVKVVGVGSVGTACGIMLLMAGDKDPLFLQLKEARASVLEPFAGKSHYKRHGQRVVVGCQLMQAASDLFLGWTEGRIGRHFYVRQLRDMKIKPIVEVFTAPVMEQYGEMCGWTLARAHARSGDAALISGYMGKSDIMDTAVADFSVLYADQTERDHETLMQAVRAGKLEVQIEGV